MKVNSIPTIAVCLAVLATAGEAPGQVRPDDSSRPLGSIQSLRGDGLGTAMESTADSIGKLTGGERFVRGNRAADDFVGADSGDRAGFVGSAAGDNSGPIRSATTGSLIRTTTGPAINRTRVRSPAPYMYEARLRVGFDVNPRSSPAQMTKVAQRLMRVRAIDPASAIEVKLEGSTAILSGIVGSGREKNLAGLLLTFEPGISNVKNELVVRPKSPPPSRSPSDSERPKADGG